MQPIQIVPGPPPLPPPARVAAQDNKLAACARVRRAISRVKRATAETVEYAKDELAEVMAASLEQCGAQKTMFMEESVAAHRPPTIWTIYGRNMTTIFTAAPIDNGNPPALRPQNVRGRMTAMKCVATRTCSSTLPLVRVGETSR